jgi:hypothetical protein
VDLQDIKEISRKPYQQDEINALYELVFFDDVSRLPLKSDGHPWSIFKNPTAEGLASLVKSPAEESRVRFLAGVELRKLGQSVSIPKELLGVIVEYPLDGGLDVVACYADGRARYINHSGRAPIFWEEPGAIFEIDEAIKAVLTQAKVIFDKIGPWEKARLPFPERGRTRITMLSTDGLYFRRGPFGRGVPQPRHGTGASSGGGGDDAHDGMGQERPADSRCRQPSLREHEGKEVT